VKTMPKGVAFLKGNFWRIPLVSEATEKRATKIKTHDVGRKGHAQRLTGLIGGKWRTLSWHIHKDDVVPIFTGKRNILMPEDPRHAEILERIEAEIGKAITVKTTDAKKERIRKVRRIVASPKPKGWAGESQRHALARKGIKTSPMVKHVRSEMGKMFKKIKGRKARGKAMKSIWKEAKKRFK